MTIECSPPSTTKKHLKEIAILEGKHTQDVKRREEEFQLLIEQLKLTSGQANISDGGEIGDSEEKRGEDGVGGDKVIEGGVNQKGKEEMVTTGSLEEELKGEKVNHDEEVKRSKNVEERLQSELQYNGEEISNLRCSDNFATEPLYSYLVLKRPMS